MIKKLLLFVMCVSLLTAHSQIYIPITVSGYNHDVIAEGTGPSSLATTSKEMDAITPSNFVICTEEFASTNSLPSGYGINNTGYINNGNKTFQLILLGNGSAVVNNVLYLMKGEFGTLTLTTPASFGSLSFLVTATEGSAIVNVTVNYTDGTNQVFNNISFSDWVGGSNAVLSGFGRIKRIAGPFTTGTYEQAPTNPRFYSTEVTVACTKMVNSIDFSNVSAGANQGSNRAFIFAISGDTTTLPIAPLANGNAICSGQTTTLSVTNIISGLTYKWYSTAAGGTPLFTGTSYTTTAITSNTTYYVQSSNSGGCLSAMTPVTVTVSTQLSNPAATAPQICSGAASAVTVISPDPNYTYTWYDAATGGNILGTGTTYNTGTLTASATYYLQASNAAGCISGRTVVTVTIVAQPANPLATAPQICSGDASTVTVISPDPNYTYTWYDAATGGNILGTGTTYNTGTLTASATYYLQASNAAGCISGRTVVTVTVATPPANPAATAPQICSGAASAVTVISPDPNYTYTWYDSATGGNILGTGTTYNTGTLTASATYYLQASNAAGCISGRTVVTVTIVAQPANPAATAPQICSGAASAVTVISPDPNYTYTWYDSATGGNILGTGTTYNTGTLTASATYYLQASNAAGCISGRTVVTVTIVAQPANPAATAPQICSGQSATITITNPDPALIYSYYTTASGGVPLATGTSYTTPPLTGTVPYYIEASNNAGCVSVRISVIITIAGQLSTPAVTATAITASSVTFSWNVIAGATGYLVSVNGGSYSTPSSGVTGTSHLINGLAPGQTITLAVQAIGAASCQKSAIANASATTVSTEIFIPNTFTPNLDGRNDVFRIYGTNIASVDLKIFNQWGELIFATKESAKGWDGTYKGKAQSIGVYVYAANITLTNGTIIARKGSINLVR